MWKFMRLKRLQLSRFKSVKGFSFIELLAVTGIISLLVGISIAGYSQFNERQKLITAGATLKNIFRDAQNRAYTQEVDCTACGCNPSSPGYNPTNAYLSGWRVDFTNRQVIGVCTNGTTFSPHPFSTYSLATDVVLSQPVGSATTVLFRPVNGGISGATAMCINNPKLAGSFYTVGVRATGVITDSAGIVASCTAP
jgi:Tfp pilus assembly protein FimT